MKRLALLVVFSAPLCASAQVEKASEVRLVEAHGSAPAALTSAPSAITLTAPALTAIAAPSAAALVSPAAAAAPVAAAVPVAAVPVAAAPALRAAPAASLNADGTAPRPVRDAAGQLREGGRLSAAPALDGGRIAFDGGAAARGEDAAVAASPAASDGPRLSRATGRAPAPASSIPLKQRAWETVDLGGGAVAMSMITGLLFLWLGAHAAFPAGAGALWMFFGGQLIDQLRKLRGVVVGGWQASHDQKYRVDPSTGRLHDVRGHKYGEDRYDEYAPGPVSARERAVIDASAFALGLPWVLPAGPKAVALYTLGAAATYAARRVYRRLRPEPPPATRRPDFEYDR